MDLPVWNVILSFASALLLFWVKVSHDEVKRLGILLSKTREEHSDKFVTKHDMHNDINRVTLFPASFDHGVLTWLGCD